MEEHLLHDHNCQLRSWRLELANAPKAAPKEQPYRFRAQHCGPPTPHPRLLAASSIAQDFSTPYTVPSPSWPSPFTARRPLVANPRHANRYTIHSSEIPTSRTRAALQQATLSVFPPFDSPTRYPRSHRPPEVISGRPRRAVNSAAFFTLTQRPTRFIAPALQSAMPVSKSV